MEHPGYASRIPYVEENDISLLRLRDGIDLTYHTYINSVCWPTVTPHVGLEVITSGWGIKFQQFGYFKDTWKARLLQKVSVCRENFDSEYSDTRTYVDFYL